MVTCSERKCLKEVDSNSESTYNEGKAVYINESGLYALILTSKLPLAKAFKRWKTEAEDKKCLKEVGPKSGPTYNEGKAVYINESTLYRLKMFERVGL